MLLLLLLLLPLQVVITVQNSFLLRREEGMESPRSRSVSAQDKSLRSRFEKVITHMDSAFAIGPRDKVRVAFAASSCTFVPARFVPARCQS